MAGKGNKKKARPKLPDAGYLESLFVGRISRVNFFVGWLIVAFGIPLVAAISAFPLNVVGLGFLPFLVGWLVALLYSLSFAVRRFHDLGRSAVELLWFLVPLVNIYFLFVIFLKPGEGETNEYGKPPGKKADLKDLFRID